MTAPSHELPVRQPTTTVILADGRAQRGSLGADRQLRLWAHALHEPGRGLVEVAGARRVNGKLRWRPRDLEASFPDAGDLQRLVALASEHRSRGREVFATPLSQQLAAPGRRGETLPGSVVWVDIDEPARLEDLRHFQPRPHVVVRSGSGGAHAYWSLLERLDARALWEVNRKLAGAVGGDLQAAATSRLMRLPGTVNFKVGRPCTLTYCDLARRPFAHDELAGDLVDPKPAPAPPDPATVRRWARLNEADPARDVPPAIYFLIFADVEVPDHGGTVSCPLPDHEDPAPSCTIYPDPDRGWNCFGCGRGGTIYDLVSLLEGGPGGQAGTLRGDEFLTIKRYVHERLRLLGAR